jgi:hypothetical protein
MTRHRWGARLPPDELRAVVHGPVVLSRSPGIAAGLRCVFAHPGGLQLPLVLRARGVQAEAAARSSSLHRHGDPLAPGRAREPWSGLLLTVEVNGRSGIADPAHSTASGNDDAFDLEASYWIGELPEDGQVRIDAAWPQAGLGEHSTVLTLGDLSGVGGRTVVLP